MSVASIPPNDLAAERAVLGCLLVDGREAFQKVTPTLATSGFYLEAHRTIYTAMLDLQGRGEAVDSITLSNALRQRGALDEIGGLQAIAGLEAEATILVNLPSYVRIVAEKAVRRDLVRLGLDLSHDGYDGSASMEDLAAKVAKAAKDTERRLGAVAAEIPFLIHDAADDWEFPATEWIIEGVLPSKSLVWIGGSPKRHKSLFSLYLCLAIASRQDAVAGKFPIVLRPKILYIAREDGGSRIRERSDDILQAWNRLVRGNGPTRPEPGALRFVIREHLDLMDSKHVAWLRDTCLREGITLLVLDTWTRLSPTADPMDAKDQARLADIVTQLREDIDGTVVVVDHTRKNRPDPKQALSSADIFGPQQKWAAAEQIVMLEVVSMEQRRIEVFAEGKDADTRRFFLTWSERGSGLEKYRYAGTPDEIAETRRAEGNSNRELIWKVVRDTGRPLKSPEIIKEIAAKHGVLMSRDTAHRHLRTLIDERKVSRIGANNQSAYVARSEAQSDASHRNGESGQESLND